jgi:hypothetical protein
MHKTSKTIGFIKGSKRAQEDFSTKAHQQGKAAREKYKPNNAPQGKSFRQSQRP